MKKIIISSGAYIASLIGAGLASGAEINAFFVKYGMWGGVGIFICSVIFAWFFFSVVSICRKFKISDFSQFCTSFIGGKWGCISKYCILIFMLCTYSAMMAAASEFLSDITGFDKLILLTVFDTLCIGFVLLPVEKIIKAFGMTGIILGVVIMLYAYRAATFRGVEVFGMYDNFLVSSVSYSGYNMLSCICILCSVASMFNNKKEAVSAAIFSGIIIFAVLISLWGTIGIYHGKINLGTFPMLTLAGRRGALWYIFYAVIMLAAVFTTAVSSAYGVFSVFRNDFGSCKTAVVFLILSVAVSISGFSVIVTVIYRICGIIGIIIPLAILRKQAK